MMANFFLNIRCDPKNVQKIQLNLIHMDSEARTLKEKAAEYAKYSCDELDLVFCGRLLKDHSKLSEAGLRPGVTVHVLKKKKAFAKRTNTLSESDVQHLVSAIKNATKNPNYRAALQRVSRPIVLENLMVATPELRDDPVALAMIRDPELLSQLCDLGTARRAFEAHPALAEAAHYIVAVVHEEAASTSASATPNSSYFYSLEALSDEDDVESSLSSDSQPQTAESSFNSAITSAQLAAALAAAQSQIGNLSRNQSAAATSDGVFTSEMVDQAINQILSSAPMSPIAANTPSNAALSSLEATSRRLAEQLQQMRELGLRDDTVNLQALQATDWNVQEAINLVFSGAMADLDTDME